MLTLDTEDVIARGQLDIDSSFFFFGWCSVTNQIYLQQTQKASPLEAERSDVIH
jgi:hypothetical protein